MIDSHHAGPVSKVPLHFFYGIYSMVVKQQESESCIARSNQGSCMVENPVIQYHYFNSTRFFLDRLLMNS